MSPAHMSVGATETGPADPPLQGQYDRRRFLHLMTAGLGSTVLLSASGASGAFGAAEPFVLGRTVPNAENTGLERPTTLTSVGGPLTITRDNLEIRDVRFERFVSVQARNIKFRNCEFVGPPNPTFASGEQRLVNCQSVKCFRIMFDRCVFRPQTPHPTISTGAFGHHFVVHRCDFSRTADGVGTDHPSTLPSHVWVVGCYIHDLAYYSPWPYAADNRTHNDCIQLHPRGRRAVAIVGNNLQDFIDRSVSDYYRATFSAAGRLLSGYTYYGQGSWGSVGSCVMLGSGTGLMENIYIQRNWCNGGEWGINFGGATNERSCHVVGNRWGRSYAMGPDANMIKSAGLHLSDVSRNVWADNGEPRNRGSCCGTWP
jgi:hypothetical protein